jgi:hypothetical protein
MRKIKSVRPELPVFEGAGVLAGGGETGQHC